MSDFPLIQGYIEEDEITIFKMTEQGDFFFLRETQKFMALPLYTCPKDPEPPVYKIPAKYPSIELTPIHILIGVIVLCFAFFIGKKTEKHRRAEENRKKKLKKREKKYKSNEHFLVERAKFFFLEKYPYPNLPFKEDDARSRKMSDDNSIYDPTIENSISIEDHRNLPLNDQDEMKNESKSSLIPYQNTMKDQNLRILIDDESQSLELDNSRMERTFILNWPLLDPKFNLNMDFSLKIENGVIKSLTTNNNVSLESFNKLMSLLMEKYFLKIQKTGAKTEILIKETKNITEPLFLKSFSHEEELTKINENQFEINEKNRDQTRGKLEFDYAKGSEIKNESSKEKEEECVDFSGKISKVSKTSTSPLNEIKNKISKINPDVVENEKTPHEEQEKIQEIKHFQFELFENGRFTKLFNSLQEIGKGAFGEVYKVIHKIENSIYAIKKVYLPLKVNEDIRTNKYFREVMLMTKFNHKNVIRYHTSWLEEPESDFKDQYLAKRKDIAKKKDRAKKKDKRKKKKSSSSNSLNHIEEQKEEIFSNVSNHERTHLSSLGFEWVASDKNIEKTSDNKKTISKHSKNKYSLSRSQSSISVSKLTEIQKSSVKNLKISKNSENMEHWSAIIDKMTSDQIPIVLYIQMHYSRQSLRNYLDDPNHKMDRFLNFQMFNQMIEGIKYIHSNGIIHRDLKPANIFIDEDNTILIGDFGLSVILQSNIKLASTLSQEANIENLKDVNISSSCSSRHAQSLTKNIGTPLYLAPEQEKGQTYDEKVDIYALGLILLEMCTNIKTGHERFCLFNDVRKGQKIPNSLRKHYQQEADLIMLMTNADPKSRPSSVEIEKCAEFKSWKEILNKK